MAINNIKIVDERTAIMVIKRRNGDVFEILISPQDIDKVNQKTWHMGWRKCIKGFYVECCEYLGLIDGKPKYKTIMLHRFILDANEQILVDHINNNPFDNRRENLRTTSIDKNSQNRKSKNSNNTTGYRNVSFVKSEGIYIVQLQIDGKNTRLGEFSNVHEAGKFAEEMRSKYYKEYQGRN
jgi:DUF971 family protein